MWRFITLTVYHRVGKWVVALNNIKKFIKKLLKKNLSLPNMITHTV